MSRRRERCGFPVVDEQKRAKLCGKPATTERMVEGIAFSACDACAAAHDAKQKARPGLDWSDPIAVAKWIAGVRLAWNDADAVALDMLRPDRDRELGPALHAKNYTDARAQIIQALRFATAPEPEPGEPAGNGGSPTH